MSEGPNASGLCMCGCGQQTAIAKTDQKRFGQVKGHPVRYIVGHCNRKSPVEYVVEDRGFDTPCWVWQRAISTVGYGNTYVDGTTKNAHRLYYERARGPVPDGLQLDHLCRVRCCVNPDHLEPVTALENSHRGLRRRLSSEDVKAIRSATGQIKDIAVTYGISATYAGQIRLGRRRVAA